MMINKLSSVTLENIDAGISKQLEDNKEEIDKFLYAIAKEVRTGAKNTSAFADKTGKLRKSIRLRKSKFVDGGYIVVASAPHSHLIEHGHATESGGRVPAHPFMRPALEKARDNAKNKIGNGR